MRIPFFPTHATRAAVRQHFGLGCLKDNHDNEVGRLNTMYYKVRYKTIRSVEV